MCICPVHAVPVEAIEGDRPPETVTGELPFECWEPGSSVKAASFQTCSFNFFIETGSH